MMVQKMNQCKDEQRREEVSTTYKTLGTEGKKSVRKEERCFCYDTPVSEAEQAAGKRSRQMKPMEDSEGDLDTKEEKQR
ncbi:unnamed protein product [Heterobilharzia americana]|nr:unnamed protein product [Heterobilharzia americana]